MFDFGKNWLEYSKHALTPQRVKEARAGFAKTMAGIPINGASFLDIGFGQGLGILNAAQAGASPVGLDINPTCRAALKQSAAHYPGVAIDAIPIRIGSILDSSVVADLAALRRGEGYDIVHSWGVLHHTGDMRTALANAASLVRPGGHLVVALYNKHWTSPAWTVIKRAYNAAPPPLRRVMISTLTPLIRTAKRLVTGAPSERTERGMDFTTDVVDRVGGYPYEYASPSEVTAMAAPLGLQVLRTVPALVPTGCNEFIFRAR